MGTYVVDFETLPIEPRPDYPPKPVGVAIKEYGARQSKYLAWGHPSQNNVSRADARRHLASLWRKHTLIFHNAKFDLDVAQTHLGLEPPLPSRFYCTVLEAFLYDPNQEMLSLKPMSAELLDMPPDEETKLYEWIAQHVPAAKRAIADAEKKGNKFPRLGAWIGSAPGRLVGPYAKGDVIRTDRLHRLFQSHLDSEERAWYDRERRLLVYLLEEESQGIPINVEHLRNEIHRGDILLEKADSWLRKRLKLPNGVELSQKQKVADALESQSMVDGWALTDKGNRSMSYPNLQLCCTDEVFLDVWGFRSVLTTQLQTFARPWFEVASKHGHIYPSWNQVRQVNERSKGKAVGTRTGRLSSSPNVQNIPVHSRPVVRTHKEWAKWEHTETPAFMVPLACRRLSEIQLLNMREFIEAPRGSRLFDRDYAQQELHILAHFEKGALMRAYHSDPTLDVHEFARGLINAATGRKFGRKPVKNTGFGIIYAMGIGLLAEKIGVDYDTAALLRSTYLDALPGIKDVIKEMKQAASADEYVRTWGGRRFKCEPPATINGEWRTLEYRMINTRIQGSAADCTKQAMLNYFEHPDRDGRLMLFTHDQLTGMTKTRQANRQMRILKKCMESVEFRVAMPTTGAVAKRWSETK